jgi:transposase
MWRATLPFSGALFAFRGKRGGLIKLLWFDVQGLCLFSKRLEKGLFQWPVKSKSVCHRGNYVLREVLFS